ncbi:MAG: sulfur carrier protein ThiS [Paramuribaculum sp.]|nr:sulfur carrier protein ThiS [Paramuribaculum sp.]
MTVTINDKSVNLPEGATLLQALEAENITPAGIATAVNDTVVPRDSRASHTLSNGDKILVIKAFYGG